MEEKYGKLQMRCKVQILACLGVLVVGLILLAASVIIFINSVTKGFTSTKITVMIVLLIVGGALFAHVVMLLTKAGMNIYDTGVVVTEIKIPYRVVIREFPAADIFALIWDGPGENVSNSRAMRKNSNTCEIITDGGRTSFRVSDAYYEDTFNKGLADFQARNNISHDLEKKKKHKY